MSTNTTDFTPNKSSAWFSFPLPSNHSSASSSSTPTVTSVTVASAATSNVAKATEVFLSAHASGAAVAATPSLASRAGARRFYTLCHIHRVMNEYFIHKRKGDEILKELAIEDPLIEELGLYFTSVSFQDSIRSYRSVWGKNLHDVRYGLAPGGELLPIIRTSNLKDHVCSIPSENIKMRVKVDGNLQEISLKEYLQNFGKYNPEWKGAYSIYVPDKDDNVIFALQASIIPLQSNGLPTEFGISAYSYYGNSMLGIQTAEEGFTLHSPSESGEKRMLSINKDGRQHFLKATTIEQHAEERGVSTEDAFEQGANNTLTIQIPIRKLERPMFLSMPSYYGCMDDRSSLLSSMGAAAVTAGQERGAFPKQDFSDLSRDPDGNIRVDITFYAACYIDPGEMDSPGFKELMKNAHRELLKPILLAYQSAKDLGAMGSLSIDPKIRKKFGFTAKNDELHIPPIVLAQCILDKWFIDSSRDGAASAAASSGEVPMDVESSALDEVPMDVDTEATAPVAGASTATDVPVAPVKGAPIVPWESLM